MKDIRPMANGEWPNLFIVGVGKGGTSSLVEYLDQHPEVFMSRVKEPHFFTNAAPPLIPAVKDEADYLALFTSAQERVRGEASVSYFWDSASASAIKRACPDAKILVVLRDPIERTHSHYWHAVRYGQERRTFRDAVEEELAGHRQPGLEPYVRRSFYAEPLERYLDTFGDTVHVLFFEDMVRNTGEVLCNVFRFLDIDCEIADQLALGHENRFALPLGPATRLLLGSPLARRIARLLVPATLRPRVERLFLREGAKPPMEPETRTALEEAFRPDRETLEALLGRLVPWSVEGAKRTGSLLPTAMDGPRDPMST